MKKTIQVFFLIFIMAVGSVRVFGQASDYVSQYYVPIQGKAAILIEESTGKVLYAKNENTRVYPASITKILTVLIALEHLNLNEYVVVGDEIESIPYDSSMAYNEIGEVMSVKNMIRLIIIPSGNETSCVAARAVAKKVSGNPDIPYEEAERIFTELMNSKARELGAYNSYFVNPHGYHHNEHYTTAYDMVLICRAAMKNDFIRQVVNERIFSGTGAEPLEDGSRKVIEHKFETRNEMLIPDSEFYYPYATGMKTGFTNQAGDCLAASAEKDGKRLIALVFDSPDGGRWHDTMNLFEYGFTNFNFEVVQNADEVIESIPITNPMLGEEEHLDILTSGFYKDFLTKSDLANINREIVYSERYITPERKKDEKREDILDKLQFLGPIDEGSVVGKVVYRLYGEVIFEDELIAAREVGERTTQTDIDYYKNLIKTNAFTVKALPFWCAGFTVLFIIIQLILLILRRRKNRKYRYRSYY